MPRKLRELRADLRRAGFKVRRQSGSHETWKHENVPSETVTLAGRDGADAKPFQEIQVRQALDRLQASERRRP